VLILRAVVIYSLRQNSNEENLMRWKRGFFRVWLVIAMIWLTGSLAATVPGIVEPKISGFYAAYLSGNYEGKRLSKTISNDRSATNDGPWNKYRKHDVKGKFETQLQLEPAKRALELYAFELYSEVGNYLNSAHAEGQFQMVEIIGAPEFPLFVPLGLDTTELQLRSRTAAEVILPIRQERIGKARYDAVLFAASIALGPPLTLIIFGLVLAWVFAGFRNSPSI
jgi:hypothetical protein